MEAGRIAVTITMNTDRTPTNIAWLRTINLSSRLYSTAVKLPLKHPFIHVVSHLKAFS
ncbi:hypothetical protein Bhyg_01285 [Pseudolycoriella hygida]|uniref:Uncharacterized protein n=1 Tax=Pseudolycoriella hygida TaxID=35572 RepID=A0A9Q0S7D8_9DIPT|nr:hypothetical protein Bhyg_01285 [Pseudolycoriella hygida]